MKNKKIIWISLTSIVMIVGVSVGVTEIYKNFNNSSIESTNNNGDTLFHVSINSNNENIILNDDYFLKNQENFKQLVLENKNSLGLPKDSKITNWEIRYDQFEGKVFVNFQTDKYYKDNIVVEESKIIYNEIVGFKKNIINVKINPDPSNDYTLGKNVNFNVSLTDSEGNQITDLSKYNLIGKWNTSLNYESTQIDSFNTSITLNKIGKHTIYYEIKNLDPNKSYSFVSSYDFNVASLPLTFPSDSELLIGNDKPLKHCTTALVKKDANFLISKVNEYGVLRTFSLITKIYADSNIMSLDNFNNIDVSLLENNNNDYFKFQITGIAKKTFSGFGLFPLSTITEGWSGAQINTNDNVKVIFEYSRNTSSNSKGTNHFDSNKVIFGGTLSSSSTITWNKLGVNLDLPYTTDFSAKAEILVNNKTVKKSANWDNRTQIVTIYNHINEYDQFGNKDIYVVCDNKAKL